MWTRDGTIREIRIDDELTIKIGYVGPSSGYIGARLDHEIIPLLLAAPELLEALRDCVTSPGALAEESHEYAMRRLRSITRTAQETIAKAEGR